MTSPIKLDPEELKPFEELQARWEVLTKQYGELHYQKKGIEAELLLTDAQLDQLDEDRFAVVQRLQQKYGDGQIMLSTGEFWPDPTPTTTT